MEATKTQQSKKTPLKKKTKSIISFVLVLVLMLTAMPLTGLQTTAAGANISGSGTASDPYLIYTAAGLRAFAQKVNDGETSVNAILMADIDLNPGFEYDIDENGTISNVSADSEVVSWKPIGVTTGSAYKGTFDGNGHTVSGMYINELYSDYYGLFGYLLGGTIKNVGIVNSCINLNPTATVSVGGIVGEVSYDSAIIENCYNKSDISVRNDIAISNLVAQSMIGGIVGFSEGAKISNCYNTGLIYLNVHNGSNSSYVGGIAAESYSAVSNCYNTGDLYASSDYYGWYKVVVGGVAGNSFTLISDSYNTGDLTALGKGETGETFIAGVSPESYGSVQNSYNTGDMTATAEGTVYGNSYGGGVIVGTGNTITDCFNTGSIYLSASNTCLVGRIAAGEFEEGMSDNCYYLDSSVISAKQITQNGSPLTIEQMTGENALNNLIFSDPTKWVTKANEQLIVAEGGNAGAAYATNYYLPQLAVFSENPNVVALCDMVDIIGSGTAEAPYYIYTAAGFRSFAQKVNGGEVSINATLMADIDLNPGFKYDIAEGGVISNVCANSEVQTWTPIGLTDDAAYQGTFDGNGHTVSGMYINALHNQRIGLFGTLGAGTIKNLGIVNSCTNIDIGINENFGAYFGNIVGYTLENSLISDCYNEGDIYISVVSRKINDYSYAYVGGVAAYNETEASNCYNTGDITVTKTGEYSSIRVGGVFGCNGASITNCYNAGDIISMVIGKNGGNFTGGVIGHAEKPVIACYNTGDVNSTVRGMYGFARVGGITSAIGSITNTNDDLISKCYNTGNVSVYSAGAKTFGYAGGISGVLYRGYIEYCYNTGAVYADMSYTGDAPGYVGAGGLVGETNGNSSENTIIRQSFNIGSVEAKSGSGYRSSRAGGITAEFNSATVSECYYLSDCVTKGAMVTTNYGTALEIEQMTGTQALNSGNMSFTDSSVWATKADRTLDIDEGTENDAIYTVIRYLPQLTVFPEDSNLIGSKDKLDIIGSGSADDPYLISTAEGLRIFAEQVNVEWRTDIHAKLMSDIDLNPGFSYSVDENGEISASATKDIVPWEPIGYDPETAAFTGVFDGNGHTISGMYINTQLDGRSGMFSFIDGGTVKNLGIENSCIDVSYRKNQHVFSAGLLAGSNGGTIANCYTTGVVSTLANGNDLGSAIGGMVGDNSGTITDSYNVASVYSNNLNCVNFVGGMVGLSNGVIKNVFNIGNLKAIGAADMCYIGGVVAYNSGTITNAYYSDDSIASGADNINTMGTALSIEKMTDDTALDNMVFDNSANWSVKAEFKFLFPMETEAGLASTVDHYLPQLKVFGADSNLIAYQSKSSEVTVEFDTNSGEDIYLIYTADQLRAFAETVNNGNTTAKARLMADIDLNPGFKYDVAEDGSISNVRADGEVKSWTPIGISVDDNTIFSGVFDGNGHTVSGMYVDSIYGIYGGLFGNVDGGTVKNVGVINSCVNIVIPEALTIDGIIVGSVVGVFDGNGEMSGCYSDSTVYVNAGGEEKVFYIGGVIGGAIDTVQNCYNTGSVTFVSNNSTSGNCAVGGVIGLNFGRLSNCYNTGDIKASMLGEGNIIYAGGVAGNNGVTMTNCYNTGNVTSTGNGSVYTGGIAGETMSNTIESCYNTGSISSSALGTDSLSYVGAITGSANTNITLTNCYYLNDCVTSASAQLNATGTALTMDQMINATALDNMVFTDPTLWVAKDFETVIDASADESASEDDCVTTYYFPQLKCFAANSNVIAYKTYGDLVGSGTASDPYLIYTAAGLRAFAEKINKVSNSYNAVLMADIDLNPGFKYDVDAVTGAISNVRADGELKTWDPMNGYTGTFDGNGHTISGLYINAPVNNNIGLFARTQQGAVVKNVGIVNSCINYATTAQYIDVGFIVGYSEGTISNCYSTGAIAVYTSGNYEHAAPMIGGVVGYSGLDSIDNCYNTGTVSLFTTLESGECMVGGVIGFNNYDNTMTNCYNTGNVYFYSSSIYYGGFVGGVLGWNNGGTITNCFNIGYVSANNAEVGGVLGYGREPSNSYYLRNCASGSNINNDGTALSIEQMTGTSALNNMRFSDSTAWVTKADEALSSVETDTEIANIVNHYLPQLAVFSEIPNAIGYQNIEVLEYKIIAPKASDNTLIVDRETANEIYLVGLDEDANTVAELKACLENDGTQIIVTRGNTVLSDTDYIGTGCVVKCVSSTDSTMVYEESTVILYGDVNGDGMLDEIDHMVMYDQTLLMQDEISADSVFFMAADMNGDRYLDIMDYFIQERQIKGTYLFDQAAVLYK